MKSWLAHGLLLSAALTGVIRSGYGCNTNYELCSRIKDDAMARPTATNQCDQMKAYRMCVDEDLADCTDNKFTNSYAVNLQNSYCDPAYICGHRLNQCFENYTEEVVLKITTSDSATRAQLCWSVMTPIMECQDKVSSDCKEQVGLLESVKQQQDSLMSICNDTMGCIGKVIQCQTSITEASTLTVGSEHDSDDCFYQNYVDYCGAYQQALNCVRFNMSSCVGQIEFSLQGIVSSLEESSKAVCNSEVTCMQELSACLCHINRRTSLDPTSMFRFICQSYPPFKQCLDNLKPDCHANRNVSDQMTVLISTYKPPYDLLCTRQQGLCPEAVQCLVSLPGSDTAYDDDYDTDTQNADGDLDISRLCLVADPVFACLGNASTPCGATPGDVTFSEIKNNFRDMCVGVAPHINTLSTCVDFYQCMKEYDLGVSPGMSTLDTMKNLYADLVQTDFWCSYLSHGYRCVAETAQPCDLDYDFAVEAMSRYQSIQTLCQGPQTTPALPKSTQKPGITGKPSQEKNPSGGAESGHGNRWMWVFPVTLLLLTSTIRNV